MVAFLTFLFLLSPRFHDHREVGLIQISNKLCKIMNLMLKRPKSYKKSTKMSMFTKLVKHLGLKKNWNVRCGWQITKYGNIIKRQFLLVHFCYQNVSWTFAHRKYTNKLGSSIWDLAVFSWIVIHRTSRENY